jgi:mono/diheme cytochrome c family protein
MRHPLRAAAVALACATLVAACEKHEFQPPDREAQVQEAAAQLTPETFDTVTWATSDERAFEGNNAYAAHCRSCHGPVGEGGTEYAQQRGVDVPSLVRPDWPYEDVAGLRTTIYTGHPGGMPTWGVAGISPREIDAAAYYIQHVLRPEALGQQGTGARR